MDLGEKPIVFLDVETTGLDPHTHEIIEFAAIKGSEVLCIKIKPLHIETAQPRALEVNGYTEAEWETALDIRVAGPMIAGFVKDCVLCAYNARFDIGFVNRLLEKAVVPGRYDYHVIDPLTLAYVNLVPKGLKSLSLKNVCLFLGLEPEPEKHRALAGATLCRDVYNALIPH